MNNEMLQSFLSWYRTALTLRSHLNTAVLDVIIHRKGIVYDSPHERRDLRRNVAVPTSPLRMSLLLASGLNVFFNREFPFIYLGAPIYKGRSRIHHFDHIVEKHSRSGPSD
ncbi:hypothetical protein CASFOL_031810 [Castilleja foliolosa]|uniref:Uncharacterized protein n=1 Tax=Castilleja foliolosa TaxID=1961234 RepID=A0ABD3C0B0_9LAMI